MSAELRPASLATPVVSTPESRWELIRMIWALAWPVITSFALESLVGLVDALMVGRLGAAPMAGVGVGIQIFHAISVVMSAVATGTVALVARYVGAGDRRNAESVLVQSLYAVVAISVVLALPILWFGRMLVEAFGVEPRVVHEGSGYLFYMALGLPASALLFVMGSGLRGAGDTRTPLLIGIVVNAVNIIGNYLLIFGKFGFPQMGVRGAALASTLSFCVGTALSFAVLLRGKAVLGIRREHVRIDAVVVRRILSIGMPTAIEQLLMQFGFLLYVGVAARYGTEAVAAYFIGVRIMALSFFPGFGFSAAASTLVGQNLGAKRPDGAERSGWETNRMGVLFMSAGGLLMFLGARWIARAFIDDPLVIQHTTVFIRTLALAQPLMAMDFTLGGALRGAGDTRFPLASVVIGFYVARLGWAAVAAFALHLDINWIWYALLGDYIVRAVMKGWRFQSGRWKTAITV